MPPDHFWPGQSGQVGYLPEVRSVVNHGNRERLSGAGLKFGHRERRDARAQVGRRQPSGIGNDEHGPGGWHYI